MAAQVRRHGAGHQGRRGLSGELCGGGGHRSQRPKDMAPGELYLYSDGGASIYLRSDGSIEIKGPVKVEGDVALTGDVTLNGDVTMTGDLSSTGNVALNGRVEVFGSLFINGAACPACLGG